MYGYKIQTVRRNPEKERRLLHVGGAGWGSLARDAWSGCRPDTSRWMYSGKSGRLGACWSEYKSSLALKTLWDLSGKGRMEGRRESITSSEPERVRCGQRGDGHGELGQSFFFFAYLRVYNFPSERRVNQNNLVLLLPLAWSARLIHIGSASSHSSTTTPAVWRWQDASSGRMPSSNLLWRAVLWWQRGHVAAAPPSAAPSALREVPPVPLPRPEDNRDAARWPCSCAPNKSVRGFSAHLNYPPSPEEGCQHYWLVWIQWFLQYVLPLGILLKRKKKKKK